MCFFNPTCLSLKGNCLPQCLSIHTDPAPQNTDMSYDSQLWETVTETENLPQHHSATASHYTKVRPCHSSEIGWSKAHSLLWLWWCSFCWFKTPWEYSVSASFPVGGLSGASCRHSKPSVEPASAWSWCYVLLCSRLCFLPTKFLFISILPLS